MIMTWWYYNIVLNVPCQTEPKLTDNSPCKKVFGTRLIWKSILIFRSWVFNLSPEIEDSRSTQLALVITGELANLCRCHKDTIPLQSQSFGQFWCIVNVDYNLSYIPFCILSPNPSLTFLFNTNKEGKWRRKQMRGCKAKWATKQCYCTAALWW